MKFTKTELPEVVLIELDVYKDSRGFFLETYHEKKYAAEGIRGPFVQDNHSLSVRGTLRGLHTRVKKPEGKLIRVIRGEIFDVAVDIRRGSPSYLKWVGVRLSAENFLQMFIPIGFAHGFYVLTDTAEVENKVTSLYDPADEFSIRWDDPEIGIPWPGPKPILSAKDAAAPLIKDVKVKLPAYAR